MPREGVDAIADRQCTDENRQATERIDRAEQSGPPLCEEPDPCDELQRHACEEQTAGKRPRQPHAHSVET